MRKQYIAMHNFEQYRQIFDSAHWQTSSAQLPATMAHWLLHQGSLTQKLQQHCSQFTVEMIQQGWIKTDRFNENFANFFTEKTACWQREVLLKGDGQDWVFAQTCLPESTIQQVAQIVPELGEKPIGLWLFPQQPVRISLAWCYDPITQCYARSSCLLLKGYPIEIKEVFLRDFLFK